MNELAKLHCSQVNENTAKLNEREITQLKAKIPGWLTNEKEGELRLEKSFKFENFDQAVGFTNRVAQEAKKEDHHPAILTEWGKITVTWWTHKIKGLHQNDFIMAAKTDQLFSKII
jgi:4a-hydroxytetrahydrobiopterin dehydratase